MTTPEDDPLKILQLRYARGEINHDEYQEIIKILQDTDKTGNKDSNNFTISADAEIDNLKEIEYSDNYELDLDEENNKTAEDYYKEGLQYYKNKDFESAIECFNQAINLKYSYESAWNAKGVSLHSLGKFSEAVDTFDKVLLINPMNLKANDNRVKSQKKIILAEKNQYNNYSKFVNESSLFNNVQKDYIAEDDSEYENYSECGGNFFKSLIGYFEILKLILLNPKDAFIYLEEKELFDALKYVGCIGILSGLLLVIAFFISSNSIISEYPIIFVIFIEGLIILLWPFLCILITIIFGALLHFFALIFGAKYKIKKSIIIVAYSFTPLFLFYFIQVSWSFIGIILVSLVFIWVDILVYFGLIKLQKISKKNAKVFFVLSLLFSAILSYVCFLAMVPNM